MEEENLTQRRRASGGAEGVTRNCRLSSRLLACAYGDFTRYFHAKGAKDAKGKKKAENRLRGFCRLSNHSIHI